MTTQNEPAARFDRDFYRQALGIGAPIIISHLISLSLNMIDTMMIGRLGVQELAAVGAANRIYFVFIIICFGFFSGAGILTSQYWGIRDVVHIRRLAGLQYVFAGAVAVLTMVVTTLFTAGIMGLFTDEAAVIGFGADYLMIALWSYPLAALSCVISFNSRCIHRLAVPTVISSVAVAANTLLNYCLIYGNLGFPELGVRGAALATVIARGIEFAAMLAYVYLSRQHPLAGSLSELLSFDRDLVMRVVAKALPATVSETAWAAGNSVYYIAFGRIGADAIAVAQVCGIVADLFQVFFYGVGNASAVMIGNELGQSHKDVAYAYARHFLKLSFLLCLVVTGVFYLMLDTIVGFYDFDAATSALLYSSLLVYVIYTTPRNLCYTLMIGVLRAGGDATYCMILDLLGVWCVGVPLAFLGACVLHWQLPAVIALVYIEEAVKTLLCLWRAHSRKWASVLI
ncbi:MAG: MATE family efflux transporter [Firmicutes bacterium]|nr:MATE family efflux transporter [Bacillota bacterium]